MGRGKCFSIYLLLFFLTKKVFSSPIFLHFLFILITVLLNKEILNRGKEEICMQCKSWLLFLLDTFSVL